MGAERVGAERVGAERVGAEQVGAEGVGAERVGAEGSAVYACAADCSVLSTNKRWCLGGGHKETPPLQWRACTASAWRRGWGPASRPIQGCHVRTMRVLLCALHVERCPRTVSGCWLLPSVWCHSLRRQFEQKVVHGERPHTSTRPTQPKPPRCLGACMVCGLVPC